MATSVCGGQTDEGDLIDANRTPQRKKHLIQVGFECIFVKDPPEHLQTECSVCLCVLRDPYLLDCCGYSFCKSCIEPIKSENKPCPLCAVQFTTYMPDKRLQRTLNDLQVYCSHKEEGCDWMGQLANLPQHLNVKPLHEADRLSGCQLKSIECKHCGDCFLRRDVVYHEGDDCSQRPYSCEYCRDFNSTFEDVTSNHWSVCPHAPVACPNGCGLSPELKQLENHIKECPLEVVECAFSYAGCNEKLPRKDMPEHITQSLAIHMSLQATSHQQEVMKLNRQITKLQNVYKQSRAEVAELHEANKDLVAAQDKRLNCRISKLEIQLNEAKVEVAELRKANHLLVDRIQEDCKVQVAVIGQEIKTAQDQRLRGHLGTLRGEIKKAQAETKQEIITQVKSDIAAVQRHVVEIKKVQAETKQEITKQVIAAVHSHVPFNVTMPEFHKKKVLNHSWYSPSFYTHPRGYKMCLNVEANGCGVGQNSHVSVFVYMKKGDYDDCLKWPFRGDITIQLLNQVGSDEGHYTRIIDVTDRANFGKRVLEAERSYGGWGFQEFIHNKHLIPHYLKDDCFRLCVQEVKLKSV